MAEHTKVFISYSQQDAAWLKRLQVHLAPLEREGVIDRWDDTRIQPSALWRDEISQALATAKVAVMIVSAHFLASDFIAEYELPLLLTAAQKTGARILPLIVSPCLYQHSLLKPFRAVNAPDKPLSKLSRTDQEAILAELTITIKEVLSRPSDEDQWFKSFYKTSSRPSDEDQWFKFFYETSSRPSDEDQWFEKLLATIKSRLRPEELPTFPKLKPDKEPLVVELTLKKNFEDFTDEDEKLLLSAVQEVLGLSALPRVRSRRPGSTKVSIELTLEQAEQLLWLYKRGILKEVGVTDARLLGNSAAVALVKQKLQSGRYDVFLCYNSSDKADVRRIAVRLRRNGILPWLDEWEQQPGLPWQESLEKQISYIKSAAVFIGNNGFGPWQNIELNAFIRQFVHRKCPVIPVVLKCCIARPELPPFLGGMTCVDFRKDKPNPFGQLVFGITGIRPQSISPL